MNTVDNAYQGAIGRIPSWVGFGLAIAAGLAAVIAGAIAENKGIAAIGVAIVVDSIVAWYSGARATPKVNPFAKSFGATIKDIDTVPWAIMALVLAVAIVIAIV
jgi:hypothetical protein